MNATTPTIVLVSHHLSLAFSDNGRENKERITGNTIIIFFKGFSLKMGKYIDFIITIVLQSHVFNRQYLLMKF